jgi:hypothetical protein
LSDIKEHNGIMYQFWRYDRNSWFFKLILL